MSILYNTGIPAAANNPSDDQPDMQTNTDAIDQIIGIDHVSFNVGAGQTSGHHLQVTFDSKNVPGAQTEPVSTLYTNNGTASTVSELFYRNQSGTFLVSGVKAFGRVIPNTGALSNALNCSVSSFGATVVIALTAGVTTGNNVCIFTSQAGSIAPNYSFTNPNLTLTPIDATQPVSFIVIQI